MWTDFDVNLMPTIQGSEKTQGKGKSEAAEDPYHSFLTSAFAVVSVSVFHGFTSLLQDISEVGAEEPASNPATDIEFPAMRDIVQARIAGNPLIFQWAERYARKLSQYLRLSNLTPCDWQGAKVCTEFSGTGCAEASFESAARFAGFAPEDIHFRYAADVDKYCRRVIGDSCPCFSCLVSET